MPRVIGLDTSLTGTGMVRVDRKPTGNTWVSTSRLIKSKSGDGSHLFTSRRIKAIVDEISTELDLLPTLVVIEAPAFSRVGGHNHDRSWLWGKVFDACVDRGIPIIAPTTNQRMQYATGKGQADKDVVLAATIRRYPSAEVTNNNIADALLLAAIGCRFLGLPIDDVPPTHYIAKKGGNWIEKFAA